ncbi:MAG: tetratricopeptide repeat protein [Phycisphaerales bacterium]
MNMRPFRSGYEADLSRLKPSRGPSSESLFESHPTLYRLIIILVFAALLSTAVYLAMDILSPSKTENGVLGTALQGIKDRFSQDEEHWVETGSQLLDGGSYQEAMEAFDKALAKNASSYAAWMGKGEVFFAMGKDIEAMDCLNRSIQIMPSNAVAWYWKGNVLAYLGRYSQAMSCYDRSTTLSPGFGPAWYAIGLVLSGQDRYAEAIPSFDRAIGASQVPSSNIWRDEGSAYAMIGRYTEALKCYDMALAINDTDCMAWYYKGCALVEMGDKDKAKAAFEESKLLGGPKIPNYVTDGSG